MIPEIPMKTLPTLAAAAAAFILFDMTPAVAGDCGRWVECSGESNLNAADLNSYIYGNRAEVEPWANAVDEAEARPAGKSKAPAAITRSLPAASSEAEVADTAEEGTAGVDAEFLAGLSAAERAEFEADLSAELGSATLDADTGAQEGNLDEQEPAGKQLGVESVISNGSASSKAGIRVITPGSN